MSYDNGINGSETIPEVSVRENEDASMQDDSYSFDESNTDNEEFHDIDMGEDGVRELDFELDKDRMNEVLPETDLNI